MAVRKNLLVVGLVVAILGVVGLGVGGYVWWLKLTEEVVTVYVKDKIVKAYKSGDGIKEKYLIFGDGETFEITDSTIYWRFNSSDLYGSMDKGKTYDCLVVGRRRPYLSHYRNIISVEEKEAVLLYP